MYLVHFSAIFTWETTFVTSCFFPMHQISSVKRSALNGKQFAPLRGFTQKGKNLLPRGANSFLLE